MAAATPRRARREAERMQSWTRRALAGSGAVLLAGTAGLGAAVLGGPPAAEDVPADCGTTTRVSVLTEEPMASVLARKPVDPSSCVVLEVVLQESTVVAERARLGELTAGLWIPDSSGRTAEPAGHRAVAVHTPSTASSPAVSVSADEPGDASDWTGLLADRAVLMGDPRQDGGAHAALRAALGETREGTPARARAVAAALARARSQGVTAPVRTAGEVLEHVAHDGGTAVVAESDFLGWAQDELVHGLRAGVPGSGSAFLDYPLLLLAGDGSANATVRTAADEVARFLSSDAGRAALGRHHLRPADGSAGARSVPVPERIRAPAERDWRAVRAAWRREAAPVHGLVVLDASVAMTRRGDDGDTAWDVVREAGAVGEDVFPARDALGLWIHARGLDGSAPHRELVPVRPLPQDVDGRSQRDRLEQALAGAPDGRHAAGSLRETVLAAFRKVQDESPVDAYSTVVVLSAAPAGRDELRLDDLLETLRQEQDPHHPVHVVTVALAERADRETLESVAAATDGSFHTAYDAERLRQVLDDALGDR